MLEAAPTRPFSRDRVTWMAYAMLSTFAFQVGMLGPLLPFLRQELGINYTLAGLHISAQAIGIILAGITGERIADRLGRSWTLRGAGLALSSGVFLLVLGNRPAWTVTGVLALGFFGALLQVMVQAVLSERHAERRAVALSEANIGAALTMTLSPVCVGGFERLGLGWRGAMLLGMGITSLCALAFPGEPARENLPAVEGVKVGRKILPPAFWVGWVVVFLGSAIEWSLMVWGAEFLEKGAGLRRVVAASAMSLFYLATVIGRVVGSRLARSLPSTVILLRTQVICLASFPVLWLAHGSLVNVAALFLGGLGVANLYPMALSTTIGLAPEQPNAASARVSLSLGFSALVTPFFLGWIADQVGIKNAYGVVPVFILAAIALTVGLHQSRRAFISAAG